MIFSGRSRELGRLRSALDRPTPTVIRVTGVRGGGKSALVRRVLDDYPHLLSTSPPLPESNIREALAGQVAERVTEIGLEGVGVNGSAWPSVLTALAEVAGASRTPFVLVVDDAHRLSEARARVVPPLVEALQAAAARDVTLHVVLIGPEHGLPAPEELAPIPCVDVPVGPLPFRSAAAFLPGARAYERLRAYCVFGGLPRVLELLDCDVTVGTNVRRLVLDPAGPLSDAAGIWLERDVQSPARYVAILKALARGEGDWAHIHAGVPDLTRSGQVAPYLKRLGELGLIEARRSLDAKPRSRSTRYRIVDPFHAFWLRFALDYRYRPGVGTPGDHYRDEIRPKLDEHIESVFPQVCRHHMHFDAIETLGSLSRESGSLWGDDYDIPVAGLLSSGAAHYGACAWQAPIEARSPLDSLDREVRETRFGFGRERRLRIVFTGRKTPVWLRRDIARRHDAQLIDADALLGS